MLADRLQNTGPPQPRVYRREYLAPHSQPCTRQERISPGGSVPASEERLSIAASVARFRRGLPVRQLWPPSGGLYAGWHRAAAPPADPQGRHIHYAVLNRRDETMLRTAGVAATQLHLLPNPVQPPERLTDRATGRARFLRNGLAFEGRVAMFCTRFAAFDARISARLCCGQR